MEEENFVESLFELADNLEKPKINKRDVCSRCRRPATVCWCPFLPSEPIQISTTVFILQHPFEESRNLKTAPMLNLSLAPEKCHFYRSKKFPEHRFPGLLELMKQPNTLLLFPGPGAVDISELPPVGDDVSYNLVLLDGTWGQAKNMFISNPILHLPKKVLTKPLEALCQFQLNHGACTHHSRSYKIENGLWKKKLSKKAIKRLEEKKNQQTSDGNQQS
ncbi:unnamed protein product [Mytilus edulis]|uniref:tRNA-uridine aminocarboxypropyltransferase n=1 Tax=Mytilus edulis TaxID=6550 RepID=A0A8S3VMJ1_MYTED|nr:unnamed protein product [Mytilus edulis]